MHLVFLSARVPLTKTFAMQNGKLISKPYPLVSRVTSHSVEVNTLNEFYTALVDNAKKNRCLFSGQLQHPLVDESRERSGPDEGVSTLWKWPLAG